MMMYHDFLGEGLFRELAAQLGDGFYDRGLHSMNELESAVRLESNVAARHWELGRRLLQDAKPEMARESFTRALQLDPHDRPARLGLACALDMMGMTQTAIEELSRCLEQGTEYRPAVVAMQYCTQKLGDVAVVSEPTLESGEVVRVG